MADDLIDVLVRLRGGNLAAAEARKVARGIDEIGDEADQADRKIGGLNRSLLAMRSSKIAGGASDALFTMSGRLKLIAAGATLGAPAIIGLGSSLTAAAGGAALLGGSLGTAAAVGLGGWLGATIHAASNMKTVETALVNLRKATTAYGKGSTQAITAQKRLNGVVEAFGGRPILKAVLALEKLGKAWVKATAPARTAIANTWLDTLVFASRLLPTYAAITNRSAVAIQKAVQGLFRSFSGPEGKATLQAFGEAFVRIAGPVGRGFTDLLWAVVRAMRVALPYVVDGAEGFARWAHGLRAASSDGQGLTQFVGLLVRNFREWWGLIRAVGRVLGALFLSSVQSGESLVVSLTGVLNHFADWINKARAAGSATKFFNQYAGVMRDLFAALATVIVGAYYAVRPLIAALVYLSPALRVLIPLFVALKVGLAAFRLGFILARVAMLAFPGGWIIAGIGLVITAVVLMYKKWAWFRHAINDIWAWLKGAATATAEWISGAFKDAIKWIKDAIRWLRQARTDINKSGIGKVGTDVAGALGFHKIRRSLGLEHKAAGGPVAAGRPYVVGEHRAELFVPSQSGTIVPQVPGGAMAPPPPQELHLLLKSEHGRTFAEWIAQVAQTAAARA